MGRPGIAIPPVNFLMNLQRFFQNCAQAGTAFFVSLPRSLAMVFIGLRGQR
jgi:hypothetical protein